MSVKLGHSLTFDLDPCLTSLVFLSLFLMFPVFSDRFRGVRAVLPQGNGQGLCSH